ncbi:MAG: penicillin acylase family protein [Anaerolineales bacterium]
MIQAALYRLAFLCIVVALLSSTVGSPHAIGQTSAQGVADEMYQVPGIDAPVSVYLDAYGVPQISAESAVDLFVGQGFVHAAYRWWQLEWARHEAQGRLAELAGPEYIARDRLMRTLGLTTLANQQRDNLSAETLQMLEAYTRGINAWLAQQPATQLAWQYTALETVFDDEINIRPWTVEDTLLVQLGVGWRFNEFSLVAEILKDQVIAVAGPLGAMLVLPLYPYEAHPLHMQPDWQPPSALWPNTAMSTFTMPTEQDPYPVTGAGSNAWAISGRHTESGLPILANDSHLNISIPSLWYENGLHCVDITPECPYQAYGFSIVGGPGVTVGYNTLIGWGFTSAQTDLGDFYRLEINPDNPGQYRFQDEFVALQTSTETIRVRGGEAVTHEVQRSALGPVFEQFAGIPLAEPLALYWSGFDGHRAVQGVLALNRAQNWDDFTAGLSLFDIAAFNAIYADTDGNIGYALAGRIPLRAPGHDGTVPVDGTSAALTWNGYVEQENMPRLFNPPSGVVYSANNAIIRPESFEHPIASFYDYGWRAARLGTLLATQAPHSVATAQMMQRDQYNSAAAFIIPVLNTLDFDDAQINDLLAWLAGWTYQDAPDSPHAAFFNVFLDHLMRLALEELPVYEQSHAVYILSQMINGPHPLWNNAENGLAERERILALALQQADATMQTEWGTDREAWHWGDLHSAIFEPEIATVIQPADRAEATREAAIGGGLTSLNVAPWSITEGRFSVTSIASMRFVVDFANLNRGYFINSTGQSDNPTSAHYADQLPLWADGTYRETTFDTDQLVTSRAITWQLIPAQE